MSKIGVITALSVSNAVLLLGVLYPVTLRPLPKAKELHNLLDHDYVPPLPQPVADALQRSQVCFLATAGGNLEPHLSLMRFTYCRGIDSEDPSDEVLVVSTQRKTRKFDILTENENVALLVHDFHTHDDEPNNDYSPTAQGRPRFSITLNGIVRVEEGEQAERYRQVHLQRNRAYSQFIVGDDIAIVTVHLTRARVCDVNDRVHHFARGASKEWNELKP